MKHRPILFSTAMVQAILDGRKTQTRRVVNPHHAPLEFEPNEWVINLAFCPYGQPGDVLWVRETFAHTSQLNLNAEDDNYGYVYKADGQPWEDYEGWKWRPSIHMPREAARLFLRIKDVRVERLQEISPESCIAEGLYTTLREHDAVMQLQDQWQDLWQSINGPESWDANPWVWVVEFERISREEAGL
jgi:hypothetical protein